MKLKTYFILLLLVLTGCMAEVNAAGCFSPDTLTFKFFLYGQTRSFRIKASVDTDSVCLRWVMLRHGITSGGAYVMGHESVERGRSLCFTQPALNSNVMVPSSQTAFIISREALRNIRSTGRMTYGNTLYELVDSIPCGLNIASLHVKDRVEGCEMWIIDNDRLPLIWKMNNNPLGIDWCVENAAEAFCRTDNNIKIAFIADPHVQAVDSHPEFVRSLASELKSTRLFNENIFAFRAALDDAVLRGIKFVVLPGDLTDNGQVVNVRTVRDILDGYASRYGMKFFVTTGNHDPSKPYGEDCVNGNFLAADGSSMAIASSADVAANSGFNAAKTDTLLHCCGYDEMLTLYAAYGFSPDKSYLYWATPFSGYDYDGYTFGKAVSESTADKRRYVLCDTLKAHDASYVAEPVKGVWLLSIDGGVYLPVANGEGKTAYSGSSTGYANTWKHKQFLIKWISKVTEEARRRGKVLVAFCHYPAAGFHNGADSVISRWAGDKAFNMRRNPPRELTDALQKAGIKIHFAGHLHQNNTAVTDNGQGHVMYNIQVPSVSAYMPAYKILTVCGDSLCRVQTVVLDSVPKFRSLLPRYMSEYRHNLTAGTDTWNTDILYCGDYPSFCDMHFRALVASRYVEHELPSVVCDSIVGMSGSQIIDMTGVKEDPKQSAAWTGFDLVTDLYRLHFAGSLALRQIPQWRIRQYEAVLDSLEGKKTEDNKVLDSLKNICLLIKYFSTGAPDNSFDIRLK